MANSNANAAPRTRVKVSDESPAGRTKQVATGEEASIAVAHKNLDHNEQLAAEGNETEEYAASTQVWNTTELLEHIISYLPGKNIVVVSGVNKMAHNCINDSSVAQSKLFLRPSGRAPDLWIYCEFYLPDPRRPQMDRQIVAQSFEPSMDAYNKMRTGHPDTRARSVSAVALCPLLELQDAQETSALRRLKRKGWKDAERANMVGLPAENTKHADMILTDPPVNELTIELTYKNSLWPQLMITAERDVKSKDGPLTVGAMLRGACSQPGDTFLHVPPMPSNNYNYSHACLESSTIDDVILQAVQEHGGSFELALKSSRFVFRYPRIVVPNAEEMMDMDANRAEVGAASHP